MSPHIRPRQENSGSTNTGGLVAGIVCFTVLLSLLCLLQFRRLKARKERIAERNAASLHTRCAGQPMMAETNPLSTSIPPPFSRHALTASIAMPEKTIPLKPSPLSLSDPKSPPTSATPSPLRPLPSAFPRSPHPHTTSLLNPASDRHSSASSGFSAFAQYPFSSGVGSRPTSTISASLMQPRPVCQLFEAVLPDELSLVRYGECLTVIQSFDDGWCLVARDASRPSRISRVSAWIASSGDKVDIGLVPAWVFAKPLKGVSVTRPFRNASVNALEFGQNLVPSFGRDAVISWSNFA